MAPIQKQWTAIAQSDGKYAADIWLNKEPIVAGKLQYLLKSIQSIDVQIELEKERAAKEKQKVAQDIANTGVYTFRKSADYQIEIYGFGKKQNKKSRI